MANEIRIICNTTEEDYGKSVFRNDGNDFENVRHFLMNELELEYHMRMEKLKNARVWEQLKDFATDLDYTIIDEPVRRP